MSQQELLERVIQVLTTLGIDYMVTGSAASSIQGEPRRATLHDPTGRLKWVADDDARLRQALA
jgi:hypothetical protein